MLNWFHFALVATVDTHMSFEPPTPQTKVQNTAKQKKHMPGDCRKISLSRDNHWTGFGFQHWRFSVASSHCAATVAFCLHVADSVPVALKQAVTNQHLKRQKGYEDDDDSHDDSDDNHNEWRSVTNLILATVTNNDKHGAMLLGDPIFDQNADSVVNLHQIARPFTLLAVVFHDQLLCLSQSFCCSHCDLLCSPRSSYIPQNEKKKCVSENWVDLWLNHMGFLCQFTMGRRWKLKRIRRQKLWRWKSLNTLKSYLQLSKWEGLWPMVWKQGNLQV